MRVIFFDIDGTLIRSGGAGKAAMHLTLRRDFGVAEVRDRLDFSGRTDPGIGRELLRHHDIEPTPDNLDRLQSSYLNHLQDVLPKFPAHVLPGVRELINELQDRPDTAIGLLTGNVRAGAAIKLTHFGLWEHFRFGGFGDRRFERDDVARAALDEAERMLGPVDRADVCVIGDTPLDVSCARAIGANVIAVKTGWHSDAELRASGPDLLLDDLTGAIRHF